MMRMTERKKISDTGLGMDDTKKYSSNECDLHTCCNDTEKRMLGSVHRIAELTPDKFEQFKRLLSSRSEGDLYNFALEIRMQRGD